jgi:hypothetical protein
LNDNNIGQTNGKVQVGILATTTFDSVTKGADRNIGYFGEKKMQTNFETSSLLALI